MPKVGEVLQVSKMLIILLQSGYWSRQPTKPDWLHCRPIRLEVHYGGWYHQPTKNE